MWAESKRRAKMRLAFVGDGVIYNPESGLVLPDQGESELALLQRTLAKKRDFPSERSYASDRCFCIERRVAPEALSFLFHAEKDCGTRRRFRDGSNRDILGIV